MVLSSDEIVGLYSFLGYKELKGIDIGWDETQITKEDYINKLILDYKDKGIINDNKQFTEAGMGLLRFINEYQEADYIVTFNQDRIVILDSVVIVFSLIRDVDYLIKKIHINIYNKNQYINNLIYSFPDLCNGFSPGKISKKVKLNMDEWMKGLGDIEKDRVIFLGKIKQGVTDERIYYWGDSGAYCYHIQKSIREEIEIGAIRKRIVELFKYDEVS